MARAARQLWQDDDWVFTSSVGAPLNPNSDYHRWKALLKEAGVREAGCMTPGTLRPPCSWSSVSRSAR